MEQHIPARHRHQQNSGEQAVVSNIPWGCGTLPAITVSTFPAEPRFPAAAVWFTAAAETSPARIDFSGEVKWVTEEAQDI